MKICPAVRRVRFAGFASLTALAAVVPPAAADTYTWAGGAGVGNGTWSTAANWQGGNIPVSNRDTSLIFTGTANLASQNNVTNFLLNALTFDSAAGAFTLFDGALDFRSSVGGASPTLTQNSASVETINNNLFLNTLGSLTIGGTGTGVLTLGGNISEAGGLTMAGSGTTRLTGNNTYIGGTLFQAGVLNAGSAGALGNTGTLSFSGGTLQFSAANASDYSSRFSGAGNQAIRLDTNGQNVNIGYGFGGAGTSLTKLGAGALAISGGNSYTGTTNLLGGVVSVNNPGALGANGTISFGGGTLQYGDTSRPDSDYNAADYSVRFSQMDGQAYSIDTNGHNLTYATGLTSGGGSLAKLGAGTLTLTGASTYTGTTTVSAGTLQLNAGGSLSNSLVQVAGGGTLSLSGGSITAGSASYFTAGSVASASPARVNMTSGTLTTAETVVGEVAGSVGVFTQSGGTHTVSGSLYVSNAIGSSGTYNLSGTGNLSTGIAYVGYQYTGVFNQSGGSFTTNGSLLTVGYQPYSSGTYNLSGTGSLSTGYAYIGIAGTGVFNQSGGSFTTNGRQLVLGSDAGSSGTYKLSGGTLTTGRTQVSDGDNTSTFTQTGGTHATGTLSLTGYTTSSVGTYNLNSGLLNTGEVTSGYNDVKGTSTFNFGGGTLQAGFSTMTFFQGLTAANVQAGGARIDSNGFNVTVAQNLVHDPALGTAPDGGLTKLGAGTLTLTGTNTFTGITRMNGGTLEVNSTGRLAATGSIAINNGGTLLLSGSPSVTDRLNNAAPVTIANGGKLAMEGLSEGSPAAGSPAGVGALTLVGGASLDFLAGVNGSTLLAASGIISGSGTISILNWTGTAQTDSGAAGNDRLLFVSAPNFTAAQLAQVSFYNDSGSLIAGGAQEFTYNGFTELVPVPEPATWLGGALLLAGAAGTIRRRVRRSTTG